MSLLQVSDLDEKRRLVAQSADLAIRDLLTDGSNPLALAVYLWTVLQTDLSLVNRDRLVNWGEAWARQIFVDGSIGRRGDEQIVSAALAAAALWGTNALSDVQSEIRESVRLKLSAELDRQAIPYAHPSYGAAFLLAAQVLDVDEPRIVVAAKTVASAFEGAIPGGRVFGIGFIVLLLKKIQCLETIKALESCLTDAVTDPRISYDDQLCILQSILLISKSVHLADKMVSVHSALTGSPMWSYLMVGMEDIPAAGDGHAVVTVSHLCRAVLLDATIRLHSLVAQRAELMLNERYSGNKVVGLFAFGFVALLLSGAWFALGSAMIPWWDAARRYWFLNNYDIMAPWAALLFIAGVVFASLLLPVTLVVLWNSWALLVRAHVQSDRRTAEVLGHCVWKVFKPWVVGVAITVIDSAQIIMLS